MAADFAPVFSTLKTVLGKYVKRLAVQTDKPAEYTLVTKSPSPFPQHKGHPMQFASIRVGKAYVSFHLVPLYMNAPLTKTISPELKKRMQGMACFNFKTEPDKEHLAELRRLTEAGLKLWGEKKYL
jgi:hypothetical protein